MDEFSNSINEIEGITGSIDGTLDNAVGIASSVMALFGLAGTAATTIFALIMGVLGILFWVVIHVLQTIPVYKLAKKTGRKNAWLAWLPLPIFYLDELPRMFVVADIPGSKPAKILGKFKFESRSVAFWVWVGIYFFGNVLWDTVMYIISIITGGALSVLAIPLSFVPNVALAWMEYVFLRDVLNMFKEDKKANNTTAIVCAVIDALIPYRFARAVCLYSIMNRNPLPDEFANEVEYTEVPPEKKAPQQPVNVQRPPQRPAGAQPANGQRPPQRPAGAQPANVQRPPQRPAGAQPVNVQRPPQRPAGAQPANGQRPPQRPTNGQHR